MKRALLFGAMLTCVLLAVSPAASGSGNSNTIYNANVKPRPANLPSLGFEASSTRQFGDEITFAGTNRTLKAARVTLSSWACEQGRWYSGDCRTSHAATFSIAITLNIYAAPSSGYGTGALLGTRTQTFSVRYRPSASKKCTGDNAGEWYRPGQGCFNGLADIIKFNLTSLHLTVPNTVVYGITYDTTHFGPSPIGEGAACYTSSGGCPYDSLNIGLGPTVTVGSKPNPGTTYLDSSYAGSYCDNGAAGTSAFRLDSPSSQCWAGYVPAVQFTASRH
jgi:hypothetical protein